MGGTYFDNHQGLIFFALRTLTLGTKSKTALVRIYSS